MIEGTVVDMGDTVVLYQPIEDDDCIAEPAIILRRYGKGETYSIVQGDNEIIVGPLSLKPLAKLFLKWEKERTQ